MEPITQHESTKLLQFLESQRGLKSLCPIGILLNNRLLLGSDLVHVTEEFAMAKRAKTKKGVAKNCTRPTKQKSAKRKGKAGGALVGVLSSIPVTAALKKAIEDGGDFSDQQLLIFDDQGYDLPTLEGCLDRFTSISTIKIIITVGGGITYTAAASAADKKFVSIVGEAPASQADLCYGGVTLQSCQTDADRIGKTLNSRKFQRGDIGLFYNPKSVMAENVSWPGGQIVAATVPNDQKNYAKDLAGFSAGTTAVVVSADPFFQKTKASLLAAAKNIDKYFCYSLQDYKSGANPGQACLHGPNLKDAYNLVGMLAKNVLANNVKAGFIPCPNYVNDVT